ncbi:Omega-6 fatty acid desaturase, endoplasmic reticulum isozyme 1 [Senna tora]|uniref:Omega-6 fatty acid desaturase, endoplasmic reticulum isozyme 1 n=1 Tax=Senna tora TaxID=362788 RepID=A0A834TE27_9FABA|nr:Omega-6 fatty acid desaturase, endoplasmic reticulum isozyme 1 [Senna tora]
MLLHHLAPHRRTLLLPSTKPCKMGFHQTGNTHPIQASLLELPPLHVPHSLYPLWPMLLSANPIQMSHSVAMQSECAASKLWSQGSHSQSAMAHHRHRTAKPVLSMKLCGRADRVKDQTHEVIEPLVITEGVVATLVGDHPHAGENAALESPIGRPEKVGKWVRKKVEENELKRERSKQCGGMAFLSWPRVKGGLVCGTLERGFCCSTDFGLGATRPPAPIVNSYGRPLYESRKVNRLGSVS